MWLNSQTKHMWAAREYSRNIYILNQSAGYCVVLICRPSVSISKPLRTFHDTTVDGRLIPRIHHTTLEFEGSNSSIII